MTGEEWDCGVRVVRVIRVVHGSFVIAYEKEWGWVVYMPKDEEGNHKLVMWVKKGGAQQLIAEREHVD